MVASSFIKIFSITVLAALSVSAQGEEPKCPQIKAQDTNNAGKKRFIVTFNSKTKNAAVKDHYEMMSSCYKRSIQSVVDGNKSTKIASEQKNTIRDFSVDGFMQGYTAYFTPEFAEEVGKMDNVKRVEEDKEVKKLYAVPQNFKRYLNRRAEDDNPTPNIDRIDQAKRPPDGKYVFPDSAGQGVNIFVVDTGILLTHSEFGGRAKFGGSFCDGCNEDDQNGHGTHVSSIAAGKTLGVARKANLVAVRVLDANGSGSNAGVIEGLSFVGNQHKSGKSKSSVVNMSLGGSFSQTVNEAVSSLTDAGVHVAAAAGNDGEDACKSSPASEPSAVTVGATEDDSDAVTDFSNIGKCVDIFAPGRNIKGAGIKNNNDNAVFSGTSQATPHVAGTMALLISKNGDKTPGDLANDLVDLSTKGVVTGLKDGSPDAFLRVPAP